MWVKDWKYFRNLIQELFIFSCLCRLKVCVWPRRFTFELAVFRLAETALVLVPTAVMLRTKVLTCEPPVFIPGFVLHRMWPMCYPDEPADVHNVLSVHREKPFFSVSFANSNTDFHHWYALRCGNEHQHSSLPAWTRWMQSCCSTVYYFLEHCNSSWNIYFSLGWL